jgi:hypothetical protein
MDIYERDRLEREGVKRLSLLKPYIRKIKVHSATCSCSIELYKQWYTLPNFFPNWNFRGVFSIYN